MTQDVYEEFASLTLGSGSAAMVLGSLDAGARRPPPRRRHLARRDPAPPDLHRRPREDDDRHEGAARGRARARGEAWAESADDFGWNEDIGWYVIHQVSSVHTRLMCATLGLDEARAPLTFPEFGNIGPASIPFTLARVQDEINAGDRVLCMGMGSGLNASVVEIIW